MLLARRKNRLYYYVVAVIMLLLPLFVAVTKLLFYLVRTKEIAILEITFFYPCINLPFARRRYLFFGTFGRFLLN